jgi:hypothetical protein
MEVNEYLLDVHSLREDIGNGYYFYKFIFPFVTKPFSFSLFVTISLMEHSQTSIPIQVPSPSTSWEVVVVKTPQTTWKYMG